MNKEKKAIFDAALDEAKKLKIGNYHTEFIAYMVYRNIKHPTEKMDVLADKAMDYMNKKRKSLKTGKFKSLEALEEALDGSAKVPDELFAGKPVANVVKALAKKVIEKLGTEAESCKDKEWKNGALLHFFLTFGQKNINI